MKQFRLIGLAIIFMGMFAGVSLEANNQVPEPWHTFMHHPRLMTDRSLDLGEGIPGAEHLYIEGRDIPIRVPEGKTVTERELEVVKEVIRNDFLVNDDTTGGCTQGYPSVALDNAGNFVVCWHDKRNYDSDIYAQRYDASGIPQGANFRVNDDVGISLQWFPSVALDNTGNFVICWQDYRNYDPDIYAQRYDASGIPQGANFRVNDDVGTSLQLLPSVALDDAGDFVICWYDKRNVDYDVYAQRYDASGHPQGVNFRVNDDVGTSAQNYPSVAMDDAGNFVICWMDMRNGNGDIYAQRYDASGIPQGANFMVNDDVGTMYQSNASIAMGDAGDFVICWMDMRNYELDIYAQRYDASGIPQGANFMVNDDVGFSLHLNPSVALDDAGDFVICWDDKRNVDDDVYAQRYDASGHPQGVNFRVNDDVGTSAQNYSSVAMDDVGDFVICWQDYRNGDEDSYAQRYDASGIPQGANFRVNDDVGTSWQLFPSVALDDAGDFVVCWEDYRNGDYDIYAQRYDAAGNPQGINFRVNDDVGTSGQYLPSVALDNAGNFVVCWHDNRNGDLDIYAQRYDASGNPQGVNFMVNDDVGTSTQAFPSVALDDAGDFVICWYDKRNDDYDIYAQRYDAAGNPQGINFRVNDDVGTSAQYDPSVELDDAGDFVICWNDNRNGDGDIYAQRYDAAGNPQGVNFRVNDDVGTSAQYDPSVALDNAGDFVICWDDYRNGDGDIYAQRYDASGHPQGANLRVNDDVGTADQNTPSVALDPSGVRFVIVWTDYRNSDGDPELVAQKYENGNPVGSNVQINEPDLFPYNHQQSATFCLACNHDILGFAWQDNRRHKGWDIYGKMVDWDIWDVACLSVVSPPASTIAPGNHDVIGQVHNFGVSLATFDVTANVYDTTNAWTLIFTQTMTIADLPSAADSTVNFGTVSFGHEKVFYTEIFTVLSGDQNLANDTASVYSNTFPEWDFETGWQGWTHTNGQAFPAGWSVEPSGYKPLWTPPDAGDSTIWIDSDAAGVVEDTALSPAVVPPAYMVWLKYGLGYRNLTATSDSLSVGVITFSGGVWNPPVELKQYNDDFGPAWDSLDVSAYSTADSIRIFFYYSGDYAGYAGFDNVGLYGVTGVEEQPSSDKPLVFGFAPGMPNPAKGHVTISYAITIHSKVSLKIYDSAGRLIRTLVNANEQVGVKSVYWNGKDSNNRQVSNGVYFLKLEAKNKVATHKLIIVR